MKKMLLAAAVAATTMASPALADATDSQDIALTANVPQECSIGVPTAVNFNNVAIDTAAGPDALKILAGSATPSQNVWTSCNYNASIRLSGPALENSAGAALVGNSSDFTNKVNYVMVLEQGSTGTGFNKVTYNTRADTSGSKTATQSRAFHTNAKLSLKIGNGADNVLRPVAGTYTAVAKIELGAV